MSRYGDIKYGTTGFEGGGKKNLLINGDMQIAQRGTSTTGVGGTDTYPTCDRWLYSPQSGTEQARFTVTQDTASIGASDLPFTEAGIKTALKLDVTTAESGVAAAEAVTVNQRIEGNNCSHININSDPITLSFYAKSDAKTGTMCAALYASSGNLTHVKEYSITTSWARYVLTFAPDSDGTVFANDNSNELQVSFTLLSGTNLHITADAWAGSTGFKPGTSNQINFADNTNNNFYLTGVQLEKGPTATAFEHESQESNLERCHRYYRRLQKTDAGTTAGFLTAGNIGGSTIFEASETTMNMRTTPSISATDLVANDYSATSGVVDGVTLNSGRTNGIGVSYKLTFASGSMTSGKAGKLISNADAEFLDFSAEL